MATTHIVRRHRHTGTAVPTPRATSHTATGPFQVLYNNIAGAAWADWLFMLGLTGIGLALMLGVLVNIAAASGALMLVMMWTAVLPPENGRYMGLGAMWERVPFVQRNQLFR